MVLSILYPNQQRYGYYFDAQNTRIDKKVSMDDKTFQFECPVEDLASNYIELEGYIDADGDRYVIKEITSVTEGLAHVFCNLAVDDLKGKKYPFFETVEQTLYNAMDSVLDGTDWEYVTTGYSYPNKKRTLRMNDCSVYDLIKQATSTYLCECRFDTINKVVYLVDTLGEVRDETFFISDFNLKKLEVIKDTHEFYTEIEPYGKDGMPLSGGYTDGDGRKYLIRIGYSGGKKQRYIWRDERYTVADSLRDDAQAKINEMSVPKVSYKIDIIDLYRNNEQFPIPGGQISNINRFEFDIGDTISVIETETETFVKQRVTEMTMYPDEPDQNTLVIANIVRKTEDYLYQANNDSEEINRISGVVEKINDTSLDFTPKNVSVTMSQTTVAGGDGLFIRKWGKVVTITGSVKMAATGNDQIVASFLSGDAPTRATFVACTAGGASTQSACYITTSGTVCVNAFSTDTLRIHGVWITS